MLYAQAALSVNWHIEGAGQASFATSLFGVVPEPGSRLLVLHGMLLVACRRYGTRLSQPAVNA